MSTPVSDLPLGALRLALAPAIADAAAFDGWSDGALTTAAAGAGVSTDLARLAFDSASAGNLPMALITAWIGHVDAAMVQALPGATLAALPVRERIRRLVRFRLDTLAGREEALARALAVMALPGNVPAALRLGWASADTMWRLAGDKSADYNHYTKRATLGTLYTATLAVFARDTSEGKAGTWAFLDRRIEGVMRFEKAKARLLGASGTGGGEYFSITRFLGRLRYPAV